MDSQLKKFIGVVKMLGLLSRGKRKLSCYHWIAKEVSEHNVRRRAISEAQNESRWADESLKQFFVRELMKKDSTGHARSFSRSIKERFELFCEKESFSVDKRHAYWWARLLKANGVGVAKEKRKYDDFGLGTTVIVALYVFLPLVHAGI